MTCCIFAIAPPATFTKESWNPGATGTVPFVPPVPHFGLERAGQVFIMDTTPLQNLFFGDPDQVASAEERHRMLWILDKLQMHTTRQLAELEISMLQAGVVKEWQK